MVGGRVAINAVCEDCVKKKIVVKVKLDDVDAKLKKTFLKRLEDVLVIKVLLRMLIL